MRKKKGVRYVMEGEKRRPVLYDVDVVIAGAGLCSTFAAIAAARCGARTLVIERTNSLGGNIGPGMIIAGGLDKEAETTLPGGLAGISKEFMERLNNFRVGPQNWYVEEAGIASYLAYEMLQEAGGKVLFDAYASDPVLRGKNVQGLFVECKGGRVAIKAKVTVDGTGDADIALRAGAPIRPYLRISSGKGIDNRFKTRDIPKGMIRDGSMNKEFPTFYNDTRLIFLVAGADMAQYEKFCRKRVKISARDRKLGEKQFFLPKPLWPAAARAWRKGVYPFEERIIPKMKIRFNFMPTYFREYIGVVSHSIGVRGAIHPADPVLFSLLEGELRANAFRVVDFLRRNAEGFEKAYLLMCPAYFSVRGGPHIEGEHTLTLEEMFGGRKCCDVLYRNIHEGNHDGDHTGFDVPYGCILPRTLNGLLVCGRGAAYLRRGHEPTGMRARPSMMVFGQTVGTAAAIAALDNVSTKDVDIKKVQKRLIKDGIYLGDKRRLKELGL